MTDRSNESTVAVSNIYCYRQRSGMLKHQHQTVQIIFLSSFRYMQALTLQNSDVLNTKFGPFVLHPLFTRSC